MNIVITGVSRGLGQALARELLRRPGHLILGISRSPVSSLESSLSEFIHLQADITKLSDLAIVENQMSTLLGSVDVLINNAGFLIHKPFLENTPEDIDQLIEVNFRGPVLLMQIVLPLMGPGSHIMNIGSMGGVQGSVKFPGLALYSATKGALTVLTEALAEELKPRGIHVNCLAPGSVQTEMLQHAFPGYKASFAPEELAVFLADFAERNYRYFNGKTLPLAITTP
ncbi:MAG: SDR family oxidoreductase [Bacteroidales bacterium]